MTHHKNGFVVVLYNVKASQSPALKSILANMQSEDQVFLYDNSPHSMMDLGADDRIVYQADPENSGLAKAYRSAWNWASQQQMTWLTLFDQDTEIPASFFVTLREASKNTTADVLLPTVTLPDGKPFSPFYIEPKLFWGRFDCTAVKTLAGINSGATFRLSSFAADLFDQNYPLDFLDYSVFRKVAMAHRQVEALNTQMVQHLSLNDYTQMTVQRLASYSHAESGFVSRYYPRRYWQYWVRVLARVIKAKFHHLDSAKVKVLAAPLKGRN